MTDPAQTEATGDERRRTESEARRCSNPDCPGDGRYQPPGRGHLMECSHDATKWCWETIQSAPVAPDEASIEALAELLAKIRADRDGNTQPASYYRRWAEPDADTILAAGYLSPAEVEARVKAGKAEAWDEGYEAFAAQFVQPMDEVGQRPRATNPYRARAGAE